MASMLRATRKNSDGAKSILGMLGTMYESLNTMRRFATETLLIDEKTNYNVKPSCRDAGYCLCGLRGDGVFRYKKWLCGQMKAVLIGSDLKRALDDGEVCMRFQGNTTHGLEFSSAPHSSVFDVFLVAALMYLSPYRPTVRLYECEKDLTGDHFLLAASHTYQTMWELCGDTIDAKLVEAKLSFYLFGDSEAHVQTIGPMLVYIRYLDAGEMRYDVRHGRRDAPHTGWKSLLADIPGSGDEGATSDDANSSDEQEGRTSWHGGLASPTLSVRNRANDGDRMMKIVLRRIAGPFVWKSICLGATWMRTMHHQTFHLHPLVVVGARAQMRPLIRLKTRIPRLTPHRPPAHRHLHRLRPPVVVLALQAAPSLLLGLVG